MATMDMTGKTCVVTGANSGIGLETAIGLAKAGAAVTITARDAAKGAAAVKAIKDRTGVSSVGLVLLDLSSLASVRAAADEMLATLPEIHVLVNNAGAIIGDRRATKDGFELTLGANHLAPFLLTNLLLDRLKASAPARIVNVASIGHRAANRVDLDAAAPGATPSGYSAMAVYGESKLANIQHAKQLAKRLEGTGVTAFSVHPGGVRSGFGGGDDLGGIMKVGIMIAKPFEISPKTGAHASLYCAMEVGIEAQSGGYFQKRIVGNFGPVAEVQPSDAARSAEQATHLWERSEALTGAAAA